MAKVQGGILGNVAGSIGAVTFGQARSSSGKVNTARQKTTPTNPNTAGQQAQRNWFTFIIAATRLLSSDLWRDDFDRAIGQLPGFQSFMRIMLKAGNIDEYFTPPADTPLGLVHLPNTLTAAAGGASGEIDVTWSLETGEIGDLDDKIVIFAIANGADYTTITAKDIATTSRASGATGVTLSGLDAGEEYLIGAYFRGGESCPGQLSKCRYQLASAES